jgi:hypothetical protein
MLESCATIGIRTCLPFPEVRNRLRVYLKKQARNNGLVLGRQVSGLSIEEGQELGGNGEKFIFIRVLGLTMMEGKVSHRLPAALLQMMTDTHLVLSNDPIPGQDYFWPMKAEEVSSMTRPGAVPVFLNVERRGVNP